MQEPKYFLTSIFNMVPVTAVLITFNEEENLKKSLPKLYWCDEIIVVDNSSTDNTLKLCNKYNCKVYNRQFDNFGNQKRYAVSVAKNDWILNVDADEILSNELIEELKTEMQYPTAAGYCFKMKFVFLNKTFNYGKEANRYFLRLFNKTMGNFNSNLVHEAIEVKGSVKQLSNPVFHCSYKNLEQYFTKQNNYTTLGAQMMVAKGKRKSIAAIVFCLPLYFLKYYFLEKNFLNGKEGFYWAVLSAYYHFAKYIKINELYAKQKSSTTIAITSLPQELYEENLQPKLGLNLRKNVVS